MKSILFAIAVACLMNYQLCAEEGSGASSEAAFKTLLTNAQLIGRWAPLKDGQLGDEKSGDAYNIVSVTKAAGDNWVVNAKMHYHDQDVVMPIPVQVKFVGEAALMIVDKLAIPNGGTYSARVLFYEHTYSGTWSGPRGGGMLYGVVSNKGETPSSK